jgi:Sulfatase-modifying factor enzyme 1
LAGCTVSLMALSCGAPSLTFKDDVDASINGSDGSVSLGNNDAAPDVPLGCANLKQDGVETDIDCGGQSCAGCSTGLKCKEDTDCVSVYCNDGMCARASCIDKVKNLNETDVDCGGTDCPPCAIGKNCKEGTDCQPQGCTAGKCQPETCDNHAQGPDETDVDCGGPNCAPCPVGKKCLALGDCVTSVCGLDSICAASTCGDLVQNGEETGKDCGGKSCPKCADGLGCTEGADCTSGTCTDHVCEIVSCSDKILNGSESDIDCGGTCTTKCPVSATCKSDSDCASGNCATTCQACPRGMVSVTVPSSTAKYCIDATEATIAAYSAFLATNPATATLPASCSTKTTFLPGAPLDANRASYPVTQVDWCDAWAFCFASGKHLCGRIGGGNTLAGFETADAKKSEWYSACSKGGTQTYPYAGMYAFGRCVDRQGQAVKPVGANTGCVGGYTGLLDMSGNVGEWENDCTPAGGGNPEQCGTRGGSYNDDSSHLGCTSVSQRGRTSRSSSVGFRCCF